MEPGGGGTRAVTTTTLIYSLIKNRQFVEAIEIIRALSGKINPIAALSLVGYCCYHLKDFFGAANAYESLCSVSSEPDLHRYRKYQAQCLIQLGYIKGAYELCQLIPLQYQSSLGSLYVAMLRSGKWPRGVLVPKHLENEPEYIYLKAIERFESGDFKAARTISSIVESKRLALDIRYLEAVSNYAMKNYTRGLECMDCSRTARRESLLSEISTVSAASVPEDDDDSGTESKFLRLKMLNLKGAIYYQTGEVSGFKEAVESLRKFDDNKSPVLHHNLALLTVETDAWEALRRWASVADRLPYPALSNMVILCLQNMEYHLAQEVITKYSSAWGLVVRDLREMLEAIVLSYLDPQRGAKVLESKSIQLLSELKAGPKTSVRGPTRDLAIKFKFIPTMMAHSRIFWEKKEFSKIESLFQRSAHFCSGDRVWRINLAHVFYMQDRHRAAARMYREALEEEHEWSGIMRANLCVSYLMSGERRKAEGIIE
ncbi:hypothetical protein AAMO2058_001231200, partial [Amorphochlora amoebiformis]